MVERLGMVVGQQLHVELALVVGVELARQLELGHRMGVDVAHQR